MVNRIFATASVFVLLLFACYSFLTVGTIGGCVPPDTAVGEPQPVIPEEIPAPNVDNMDELSVIFVQQDEDPTRAADFRCILVKKGGGVDTCYALDKDKFWKQVEYSYSRMIDDNTKVIIYEQPYAGEGTFRTFERLATDAGANVTGRSPNAKYAFTLKEFESARFMEKATELDERTTHDRESGRSHDEVSKR